MRHKRLAAVVGTLAAVSAIASHVDNAAEGDETMEVYLVANTLPPTGPPPITINGDLAILDPLAVFGPVSYQFKQDDPLSVGLHMDQPLPDDANLVGTAFLWQFVTVTPAGPAGQISVSDVMGSVVHPKVAAAAAAAAKAGSSTRGMPAARRCAVLNFCASCKEPRLSVSTTRALVRAVRQQAGRAR